MKREASTDTCSCCSFLVTKVRTPWCLLCTRAVRRNSREALARLKWRAVLDSSVPPALDPDFLRMLRGGRGGATAAPGVSENSFLGEMGGGGGGGGGGGAP